MSRSGTSRDLDPPQPEHLRDFQIASQGVKKAQFNACQVCSFISERYQHCHHEDGDHTNNDPRNLNTYCPLCHLTNHLGFVGANGMGKLVLVDDMTQAQLNVLQRIDWVLRYQISIVEDVSLTVINIARRTRHYLSLIESTASQVKAVYKTDNPAVLADQFLGMTTKQYAQRQHVFPKLRLLFEPSSFTKEIEAWGSSSSFDGILNPENWVDIAKNVNKAGAIL